MPKIRVLPEVLANKIAAGEIVERPASVVKELLENALDAGARRITVGVEHGGRRLMRVQDDGEGMSHDDAILAFEHHATSKLREAEDLLSIATLGFRGEALPSIASVSRLSLRSIDASREEQSSNIGTEIVIYGGVLKSVKSIPWAAGTEVTVRDLFFNVPARKKFLKSNDTELSHITRLVTQYAMANPDVACTFIHDGRPVFAFESATKFEERIYQIMGRELMENLVPFDGNNETHRVFGFASRPHEQRSNPNSQYFYVNKRMVRDKLISHAVHQAYGPVLARGTYPVVLLFVAAPPSEIDVNVHPAKTEVRFRDGNLVHDLIRNVLDEALLRVRPVPRLRVPHEEFAGTRTAGAAMPPSQLPIRAADAPQSPLAAGFLPPMGPESQVGTRISTPAKESQESSTILGNIYNILSSESSSITSGCGNLQLAEENTLSQLEKEDPEGPSAGLRPIGQLSHTYILASDAEGLVLIDQHVAHERILFEQYLDEIRRRRLECQRLLLPLTFDLTPSQKLLFRQIRDELAASGFEAEEFGGNTIAVKAVPASLSESECRLLILEILERLETASRQLRLEDLQKNLAAGLACRAAVKANTPLHLDKMIWLVERLSQTRFPHACPHGRPIQLRVSLREIARRFQRI